PVSARHASDLAARLSRNPTAHPSNPSCNASSSLHQGVLSRSRDCPPKFDPTINLGHHHFVGQALKLEFRSRREVLFALGFPEAGKKAEGGFPDNGRRSS